MALSRLSAKARQTDRTVFGYRDRSNMAVVDDDYVFCVSPTRPVRLGSPGLSWSGESRARPSRNPHALGTYREKLTDSH
jgi:hypothetical protein